MISFKVIFFLVVAGSYFIQIGHTLPVPALLSTVGKSEKIALVGELPKVPLELAHQGSNLEKTKLTKPLQTFHEDKGRSLSLYRSAISQVEESSKAGYLQKSYSSINPLNYFNFFKERPPLTEYDPFWLESAKLRNPNLNEYILQEVSDRFGIASAGESRMMRANFMDGVETSSEIRKKDIASYGAAREYYVSKLGSKEEVHRIGNLLGGDKFFPSFDDVNAGETLKAIENLDNSDERVLQAWVDYLGKEEFKRRIILLKSLETYGNGGISEGILSAWQMQGLDVKRMLSILAKIKPDKSNSGLSWANRVLDSKDLEEIDKLRKLLSKESPSGRIWSKTIEHQELMNEASTSKNYIETRNSVAEFLKSDSSNAQKLTGSKQGSPIRSEVSDEPPPIPQIPQKGSSILSRVLKKFQKILGKMFFKMSFVRSIIKG